MELITFDPPLLVQLDSWEILANESEETEENRTIGSDESEEFTQTPISVALVILLSGLICVTVVGNVLVCLAVILVRKLRRPQNYLLVSLATSDLLVAVCVMPLAIVNEVYENDWPLNPTLCDLWVSGE